MILTMINPCHFGQTIWKNSPNGKILRSDVRIAKNYLDENELKELNDLVNIYLDIAENRARRHIPMKMFDWVTSLEEVFKINMYDVLNGKGKISHDKAIKKADSEYDKYAVIQDKSYISDFDKLVYETEQLK